MIGGIPHLPVVDSTSISSPQVGMLIFSSTDLKPLIYTGKRWESLCTNSISVTTEEGYFVIKKGIPYLPSLNSDPASPISGTIYYSTVNQAIMVYNGTSWIKMSDMVAGTFNDNSGFTSGLSVQTYKLPVMGSDPSPAGLSPC